METIRKAGALIIKNKKLLIVRDGGKKFFVNPGGKYEDGENAEACLRRELKEELRIDLRSFAHYQTYTVMTPSGKQLLLELYFVTYQGKPKPDSEIAEMAWMSQEDFTNMKFVFPPSFEEYVPELIADGLL